MIRDAICEQLLAMGLVRDDNTIQTGFGCLIWTDMGAVKGGFEVWIFSDEAMVWDGRSMMVVAKIPFSDPDLFVKIKELLND